MKTNESLSSALGIEHIEDSKQEIILPETKPPVMETSTDNDQEDDYNLSRKTFRDLINKGNGAIEDLTDLAKDSESPRAYEVLATLMKTVSDATKDLYDLQKKTKELKKIDGVKTGADNITVEKAVFVGTPTELLEKLREEKSNEQRV